MKEGNLMAKIISIANQKGGIGKTTTATSIACILKQKGYRTILIDTDPQSNSSDTYKASIEGYTTLSDVILATDDPSPMKDAIQETESGLIIAADEHLAKADRIIGTDLDSFYLLDEAIETITDDFDYIIIDTAPTKNIILQNSLIASDEVIIPVTADRYGFQGIDSLIGSTIKTIKKHNKRLKIAGLLLVRYNPRTVISQSAKEQLQAIADKLGIRLFSTTIRESTKVKEAQAKRIPLQMYAPGCTTARDYDDFVDEWLKGDA